MGSGSSAAAGVLPSAKSITLHDHIRELRNRVFVVAIIFIITSALAYQYRAPLIDFLLKPLGDEKLIYLNPGGGFNFIFQITLYAGMAATIPFFVYNLYRFISPALPAKARRYSAAVILTSIGLLIIGVAFGYIFAIPGALHFLTTFAEAYVTPSLTADSYLNFILAYTAGLGVLFQLPLILLFIHWIHPLKPGGLMKFQRYMIVIAFVAAALITPTPDIMNQTIIAAPIVLMYQIGVIAIALSVHRQKRRTKKTAKKAMRSSTVVQDVELPANFELDDEAERVNAAAAARAIQKTLVGTNTPKVFDISAPAKAHKTVAKQETIRGSRRHITATTTSRSRISIDGISLAPEAQ